MQCYSRGRARGFKTKLFPKNGEQGGGEVKSNCTMGVARVSNEEATKAKEEEASKEIQMTGAEVARIMHGNHLVKIRFGGG